MCVPFALMVDSDVALRMLYRILEAYRTGHGRLTVRGKASIEQLDRRNSRSAVIITEVSYDYN